MLEFLPQLLAVQTAISYQAIDLVAPKSEVTIVHEVPSEGTSQGTSSKAELAEPVPTATPESSESQNSPSVAPSQSVSQFADQEKSESSGSTSASTSEADRIDGGERQSSEALGEKATPQVEIPRTAHEVTEQNDSAPNVIRNTPTVKPDGKAKPSTSQGKPDRDRTPTPPKTATRDAKPTAASQPSPPATRDRAFHQPGVTSTPSYGLTYFRELPKTLARVGNGNLSLIFPLLIPAPITSAFGWRVHPITGDRRFHAGTDLGAPMGTPVLAAYSGFVEVADFQGGYGLAITLTHNRANQKTLYAHLSEVFVKPGEWVEQGTVIGLVGSSGNSTGPHLHFELWDLTSAGWTVVDPGAQLEYALAHMTGGSTTQLYQAFSEQSFSTNLSQVELKVVEWSEQEIAMGEAATLEPISLAAGQAATLLEENLAAFTSNNTSELLAAGQSAQMLEEGLEGSVSASSEQLVLGQLAKGLEDSLASLESTEPYTLNLSQIHLSTEWTEKEALMGEVATTEQPLKVALDSPTEETSLKVALDPSLTDTLDPGMTTEAQLGDLLAQARKGTMDPVWLEFDL